MAAQAAVPELVDHVVILSGVWRVFAPYAVEGSAFVPQGQDDNSLWIFLARKVTPATP